MSERLHESLAHAPLMLEEQHAAELREASRRIVEGAKDALPVFDRQCEHLRLGVPGTLEPLCTVVESGFPEQTCELEDVLVGYRNAREHHPAERTHVRPKHKVPSIEAVFGTREEGTTQPAVTQPGEGSCGLARHKPTASPLPFPYSRVWHGLGAAA